jgi:acyl-CoA thioesterase
VKPREKYEIPVIKLEKNLPGHEEKLKIREKKETEGKKGQKRQNQVFRRRIKKNMKDEAVGNDYLLTQSSGILSQTSIVNKYLIVLPPDLNNY